jgi:hypothetical protein
MAGEAKRVYGTEVTLQTSGASVANNAISAAAATVIDNSAHDYVDGKFVLRVSASVAFTQLGTVQLLLRPLDIDAANNDAPVPTAAYPVPYRGSFTLISQTASQYQYLEVQNMPRKCEAYLLNAAGQTISNWDLLYQPMTLGPA